ncbi:MAG: flavodoxin family protein [Oscillospiraceae bacterium]|jgi:multimeric flavodoxin WrbA|nr:flavodoxin family protein [Oscillospiraceae bacterium]
MNIIGFSGSPRPNGNTAWAVEQILGGAQSQGADTQLFTSAELDIKPCRGCQACVKGNGCVINDDMQSVYAALKTADALVLGVPIYMGQMSAQTKAFTDRLFAQIKPRFSPTFKEENAGKKLILVWTQGNPDASRFQAYYDYSRQMFSLLEFDVRDVIVITGTRSAAASEQVGLNDNLREVGVGLTGG